MVTITNFITREGKDDKPFVALELTGDVELIQSMATGRFYATAKKCTIVSTFSEELAKMLVGKTLPGRIDRVACDPYSYTIPESKESITLSHTYSYVPAEDKAADVAAQSQREREKST